jgi:pimeloyl-ACP methyl ester carboxylesterase
VRFDAITRRSYRPSGKVARVARRRAAGAVLGALLAVGLLAGCTVGPSTRPPVAVRADLPAPPRMTPGAPVPLPPPEPQHATLPVSDCTPSMLGALDVPVPTDRTLRADCGTLTVPLDPAQPALGTVTLGVVRAGLADVPGRTPLAARPPLLVLGDTATDPTARRAVRLAAQVPTYLLAQYAIIGLDRRGAGTDTLDCTDQSQRNALVDADPLALDATVPLERARAVVQACNVALDGQLSGFSSAAAADDIEAVRQSLGVARLSAVGTGDGATALAGWARAHPRAVGRLVLDGPSDPTVDEPQRSEARAKSAEAAFDAFAQRCTARSSCSLGADPRTAVTALITSLRGRPLAAPDDRLLTAGAAVTAIRVALGEPTTWNALADALQAARAGDPVPLLTVLAPTLGQRGRYDAALATDCNDTRNRIAPAQIQDLARKWQAAYPLFGGSFAADLVACAPWPTGGTGPQAPAPPDLPPLTVIGSAAGPRAPMDAARAVAQSLPSAVFLGWQGAATGAFPRTQCVSSVVDNMLVDGKLPDPSTLCPP